jgi:hypothetical protein
MHASHDWVSMAAEGAGCACSVCMICTCHNPDQAVLACLGRPGFGVTPTPAVPGAQS